MESNNCLKALFALETDISQLILKNEKKKLIDINSMLNDKKKKTSNWKFMLLQIAKKCVMTYISAHFKWYHRNILNEIKNKPG